MISWNFFRDSERYPKSCVDKFIAIRKTLFIAFYETWHPAMTFSKVNFRFAYPQRKNPYSLSLVSKSQTAAKKKHNAWKILKQKASTTLLLGQLLAPHPFQCLTVKIVFRDYGIQAIQGYSQKPEKAFKAVALTRKLLFTALTMYWNIDLW